MSQKKQRRNTAKKKSLMRRVFSFKRTTSTTEFEVKEHDEALPDLEFLPEIEQGFATQIGHHHDTNEDTHFGLMDLFEDCPPSDHDGYQGTATKSISTFAVMDGHGGDACSIYAAQHLKQQLSNLLWKGNYDDMIGTALHHSFKAVENDFCTIAKRTNDTAGSCALCVVFKGNKVFCGNAGDSKAILFVAKPENQRMGQKIVDLNDRHSSELKSERVRIKAAGGRIEPDGSIYGVLFPSRGFGDIDVKANGKPVVIATPDGVGIGDRPAVILEEGKEYFAVIASDGLWDFVSDERVMSTVLDSGSTLDKSANDLIRIARRGGSEDDITIYTLRIRVKNKSRLESVAE